ncbi:hypothetical protein SME05J_08530 [Serratia marcescens]|nr:hypothetical protein SME05J_08530 [Serratia marcescens]BEM76802.1 hypothetical protein SME38J_09050 [Serratia marcescens]
MPYLYNTALLHIWVIAAGPRGYRLCGVAGPFALRDTGRSQRFIVVSSLICLGFGLVHLLGMTQRRGTLA